MTSQVSDRAVFWNSDKIDKVDPLNETIWSQSPTVQDSIQSYRSEWGLGEVAAQQAMHAPHRLSWVPDIVGDNWRSARTVIVVGSAYGPFITNRHGYHEMRPDVYDQPTAGGFVQKFIDHVVLTRSYYRKVADLVEPFVDVAHLVMLDLCRVAFVRVGLARDEGGDGVVNSATELFSQYVESRIPREWLWQRIVASEGSTLVALGTVAEHGLLRLFASQLSDVDIHDSAESNIRFESGRSTSWPRRYAHDKRKLTHRSAIATPPIWIVKGTTGGRRRTWMVAVVPHVTGARGAFGDYSTRALRVAVSYSR